MKNNIENYSNKYSKISRDIKCLKIIHGNMS